jgi:DNA repair protein RadC
MKKQEKENKTLWPREKLISHGAENLQDYELLALLLRTGYRANGVTVSVLDWSRKLLKTHPLSELLHLNRNEMLVLEGMTPSKASVLLAVGEINRRTQPITSKPIINSIEAVVNEMSDLKYQTKEHFAVLYLDARYQLLYKEVISIGILNASLVHPREVFAPAIEYRAGFVILVHNHPSGNADPSDADLEITVQLIKAGELLGIEVMDHVIVAHEQVSSLKKQTDIFN